MQLIFQNFPYNDIVLLFYKVEISISYASGYSYMGEKSFEIFFEENQNLVYKIIRGYIRDREKAKDILIDSFLTVYERWNIVSKMENPVGYIVRVAVNRAKKSLIFEGLKKIFSLERFENDPVSPMDVEDIVSEREKEEWLQQQISKLKDIEREVVMLRDGENMKFEEVAQALNLNLSTTKSHYRRAKLKILEKWEEENERVKL